MSRRSVIKKRYPKPDSNYNSCLVSLLTARILKSGKKSLADSIILETFALIQEKTNLDTLQVFEKSIQIHLSTSETLKLKKQKNLINFAAAHSILSYHLI